MQTNPVKSFNATDVLVALSGVSYTPPRFNKRLSPNDPSVFAADLLKRHAERHDKREQSGLHSQPKPGRIKGSTSSKKKLANQQHQQSISNPSYSPSIASSLHTASYSNLQHHAGTSASASACASHASGSGDYFETSAAPPSNGRSSLVLHIEPLPSPPIIDDYDHNRESVLQPFSSACFLT
jgi:hypothetical protein